MHNPAEVYEREMVPALFGPWSDLLLAAAAPRAGERVLDLACGTGIVARQVARQLDGQGAVTGLDLSEDMLAVARPTAAREGLVVDWRQGRAEALPFDDGSFDLVVCQQGLQFVPGRDRALAQMHRVLADGGRVALALWMGLDRHPFFATFNASVVRHLGVPALAAPFVLADKGELHAMLAAAGFREIHVEAHSLVACFPDPDEFVRMEVEVIAAAIPTAQHLDEAARRALASAIADDVGGSIREVTRDGRMYVPMHAHIATARR